MADAPQRIFTLRRLGLVTLSGLLGALAFPLAFPWSGREELLPSGVLEPLAFVCLLPTLWAIRGLSGKKAFWTGVLAGMVFFTGTFWWVNVAMTTFGGMPNFLSIPSLEALVFWCAFHWGLAFGLTRIFELRLGYRPGVTFPIIWMATELLRNYLFSGYPWANLGYSQTRNLWLSQIGSLVGVYGIAGLVALVNVALYETLAAKVAKERAFPTRLLAGAIALLVFGHVFGAIRVARWDEKIKNAPHVKVAVVQGNIDQKLKLRQSSMSKLVLEAYNVPTVAADEAGAELILWPEASYPMAFRKGIQSLEGAGLAKSQYSASLLLGVDVRDFKERTMENSMFLVTPDLRVAHAYTKHHLVPFGEHVYGIEKYIPITNWVPIGFFKAGDNLNPAIAKLPPQEGRPAELKIGIMICFDAIFPEIARSYANDGVDLLVNPTNDAWYGVSSAPFQFLRMVAMRAIETGKPVARAANTGVSAFIDPLGRILQPTPLGFVESDDLQIDFSRRVPSEFRVESLPIMSETTLYVVSGDLLAYVAALLTLFWWGRAIIKERRRGPGSQAAHR